VSIILLLISRSLIIFVVPRMTPILRNRHEKVQEAPSINLIGCVADRGAKFVPAWEWMRIGNAHLFRVVGPP